eukprot:495999-Rhodomonas_salina.1
MKCKRTTGNSTRVTESIMMSALSSGTLNSGFLIQASVFTVTVTLQPAINSYSNGASETDRAMRSRQTEGFLRP